MSDRILPEVHQLNALFKKVQAYKAEHPETKLGYYPEDYGSLLNAYREGDLTFDECIAHLKSIASQSRDGGLEEAAQLAEASYADSGWHSYYQTAAHSIAGNVRGLKSAAPASEGEKGKLR